MTWEHLIWFAVPAIVCWLAGAVVAWRDNATRATVLSVVGSVIFFSFIVGMWLSLERPPMRTMGETRLWYSFFMLLAGTITYARWRYRWVLSFSTIMASVFMIINIVRPEIHDATLMPALQSVWFVPHVIVYMFSYAMMGAATLFSAYLWFRKTPAEATDEEMSVCDVLVRIGWAFLTLGMTMGALWAKEAWGDYWTWDPKETWAFATWISYLIYLHLRPSCKNEDLLFSWIIFSFILLQMCWWGINFLPSAQGTSIHIYG